MFWVGVGAVGGIYAYRKGERVYAAAKERGLAGSAQLVATTTMGALVNLRHVDTAQGLQLGSFRVSRMPVAATSAKIVDTREIGPSPQRKVR